MANQRNQVNGSNGHHLAQPERDHDNYEPVGAEDIVELQSDDFPTYFAERGGRLYHSSLSPYPLPIDAPEQERLTNSHNFLQRFLGANFVGPVQHALLDNDGSGRRKLGLDMCTGKGTWVLEMAEAFPRAQFIGFDIVPIATRYPPINAQFEICDVNQPLRWSDGMFDLVNARFMAMAVRNYRPVLLEVARMLRPGGLFVSYEWAPYPAFDPSLRRDPSVYAPQSVRFHTAVNSAMFQTQGVPPNAGEITALLSTSGLFSQVSPVQHAIPIGAWSTHPALRSIGASCLEAHEIYADSVKSLLLMAGWSEGAYNQLKADYIQEIRDVQGLVSMLYTVHARKV